MFTRAPHSKTRRCLSRRHPACQFEHFQTFKNFPVCWDMDNKHLTGTYACSHVKSKSSPAAPTFAAAAGGPEALVISTHPLHHGVLDGVRPQTVLSAFHYVLQPLRTRLLPPLIVGDARTALAVHLQCTSEKVFHNINRVSSGKTNLFASVLRGVGAAHADARCCSRRRWLH